MKKSIALDDIREALNEQLSENSAQPTIDDRPWIWEVLIEPLEAIVRVDDEYFRVPVTMQAEEPVLAPRAEWIAVEQVWVEKAIRNRSWEPRQPKLFQLSPDKQVRLDELIVFNGGAIKALGDGRLGGYLVRFGSPDQLDLDGEFFNAKTDFGPHKTSLVFYHHGLDPSLKRHVLDQDAALKTDDVGVWIESQLDMRNEYEQAVYHLAEMGKLGWSSGTAPNLIERAPVAGGKAVWIKSWPLGLDASLTPAPAEPMTRAMPLKAYSKSSGADLKTLLQGDGDPSQVQGGDPPAAEQVARKQRLAAAAMAVAAAEQRR